MYEGRRILGLIPARGGSKGLPGKNLRELGGKPLIAWSIEASRQSRFVDATLVSTDCPQIAESARRYGAEAPFLRPAELATDTARSFDAILHALAWRQSQGHADDLVVVLQPTSPLRTGADIDRAVELFFARRAEAVVSVCEVEHHPWWTNTLPEDGNMGDFLRPEALNRNRQELPPHYRLNGALYLAAIPFLQEAGSFYGPRTYAYLMPRERSVDIDSGLDLQSAELLLKNWHQPPDSPGA